jgi:Leucine-rich repeat (LRR) protein
LTYFAIVNNTLRGTIPTELGNLSQVENLHLTANQLSGTIPTELGNLTNVKQLHLRKI